MAVSPADPATLVVAGGFAIGTAFGFVAARSNFCTMGALSDIVNMGHWSRMRMWLLAVAVAMAGATVLQGAGWVDLSQAVAQRPVLPWLSLVVGGLCFGVGMTLAGGCTQRNLVRLGGGSVRSLVVLVFTAIAAYMTLKGLFGAARAAWLDPVNLDLGARGWKDQSLSTAVAQALSLPASTARASVAALLAIGLAGYAFADRRFRGNAMQVAAGIVLGALVVAAWYVSGHLGHGENPETLETVYFATNSRTIEALSFVAPVAYALEYALLWTDKSLHLSFGVASAGGVVVGSAVHALASGRFRWEGFASLQDLRDQLLGAMLMGFGGVTALGCTVGQGMSGVSTLAIGSFIATAALVAGSVGTLRWLAWRAERA